MPISEILLVYSCKAMPNLQYNSRHIYLNIKSVIYLNVYDVTFFKIVWFFLVRVYRPIREFFTYTKTSPLPVKGFKF